MQLNRNYFKQFYYLVHTLITFFTFAFTYLVITENVHNVKFQATLPIGIMFIFLVYVVTVYRFLSRYIKDMNKKVQYGITQIKLL